MTDSEILIIKVRISPQRENSPQNFPLLLAASYIAFPDWPIEQPIKKLEVIVYLFMSVTIYSWFLPRNAYSTNNIYCK